MIENSLCSGASTHSFRKIRLCTKAEVVIEFTDKTDITESCAEHTKKATVQKELE